MPEFRIASYNAYNLFGDKPDVHSSRPNPPAPEEQLDALGEMILSLEADAIALQEVQNEKILGELFRTRVNPKRSATRSTVHLVRVHSGTGPARHQRRARHPPGREQQPDLPRQGLRSARRAREALLARPARRRAVRHQVLSVPVFGAHLKSKLGADHGVGKRALETHEIRTILETPQFGGNPFIAQDMVLCGDMNDDPGSEAVAILKGGGPTELVDVLGQLESAMSFPTHHRYKKTRLDYILASPTL